MTAFVFRSGDTTAALPEILDLWSPAAPAWASFDVSGPAAPAESEAPVWHVDLPARDGEAEAVLRDGETRLAQAGASLASVPGRLAALGAREPGLSFDVADAAAELDPAEAELLRRLGAAAPGQESFGAGAALAPGQAAAQQPFQSLLEQLGRQLGQLAWVETAVDGELWARSLVSWTGDARTGWRGRPVPQRVRTHTRALALAVASRLLWLQTAIIVVEGAAQISLRLAVPGGAVLAIPAVFNFINQLVAQVRRRAQLAQA